MNINYDNVYKNNPSYLKLKYNKYISVPINKILKYNKSFIFNDSEYFYFVHDYNMTWNNERTIEIPIIKQILGMHTYRHIYNYKSIKLYRRILEVGNVLSHYTKPQWDIVDKFDTSKNVIKEDITEFKPVDKYNLIVSISTFEHIGFDDDVKNTNKVLEAFNNLKNNCLKPDGLIALSISLGYNKDIDNKIYENIFGFDYIFYLKRISKSNEWRQVSKEETFGSEHGKIYPYANDVCICLYKNKCV